MLWPRGVGGDKRQVDVGALSTREFLFGLLAGFLQPLQRHRVLPQVDPLLLLEGIGNVVNQLLVEVVATEMGVAVGADHLEHAVLGDVEHRHVERATTEVEDDDLLSRP